MVVFNRATVLFILGGSLLTACVIDAVVIDVFHRRRKRR